MTTDHEHLSSDERTEFQGLPRERQPGRLLEERTVKALRARGLLRARRVHASWLIAGLAASVALFVSGFATGQWMMTREVTSSLLAAHDQTAMHAAQAVQRTGSAYVAALVALSRYADSTRDPALLQGREAATAALYAAASELSGLAPDDAVAKAIRSVLIDTDPRLREERERARNVLWF
jgi:hypothetical protein